MLRRQARRAVLRRQRRAPSRQARGARRPAKRRRRRFWRQRSWHAARRPLRATHVGHDGRLQRRPLQAECVPLGHLREPSDARQTAGQPAKPVSAAAHRLPRPHGRAARRERPWRRKAPGAHHRSGLRRLDGVKRWQSSRQNAKNAPLPLCCPLMSQGVCRDALLQLPCCSLTRACAPQLRLATRAPRRSLPRTCRPRRLRAQSCACC